MPVKRQTKQAIKKADPKAQLVTRVKATFLADLRKNGGNVSKALLKSKLSRKTAYEHFKTDKIFADAWLDALEASNDDLYTEALRRAKVGVLEPVYHNGKKVGDVRKYSDTLLIFLLKQSEAQKKWRNRIIQTGNLALSLLQERGKTIGLTNEQIDDLQATMTEKFRAISLI